jgi:GNAT superfamily N-acetyltransferase
MRDGESATASATDDRAVQRPPVTEGDGEAVTCALLADRPELVPLVAGWMVEEWGADWPGKSPADIAEDVAAYARRGELPLAVVAFRGGRCVGTAAVRATCEGYPETTTPWLVRVYVAPAARGAGVGAAVVRAAGAAARDLGHGEMHLICTPARRRFYERLGWEVTGDGTYHGHAVHAMCTALR